MKKCLYCGSSVEILEGRKPKQFCGYNCRNKYYYKKSREGLPIKKRGRPKSPNIDPDKLVELETKIKCQNPVIEPALNSEMKSFLNDEYPLDGETISPTENIPQTLQELKYQCPPELTGIDRSAWISEQRQKFNL